MTCFPEQGQGLEKRWWEISEESKWSPLPVPVDCVGRVGTAAARCTTPATWWSTSTNWSRSTRLRRWCGLISASRGRTAILEMPFATIGGGGGAAAGDASKAGSQKLMKEMPGDNVPEIRVKTAFNGQVSTESLPLRTDRMGASVTLMTSPFWFSFGRFSSRTSTTASPMTDSATR